MANITSTTRPITSGANVNNTVTNNSDSGVATEALDNTSEVTTTKPTTITPNVNTYATPSIRQQAIDATTINNTKPTVVHENRYLNNASKAPTVNMTSSERSDLNILNRWANKLRATHSSSNVTTYTDDKSAVPLLRRDTTGFFNVDYNPNGTYHVTTTGVKVPFTDTIVGKWDLGEFSWNPIKAYAVASPIGTYLTNYGMYDTKNKIIQGTLALSNSYSNYYDGANNFVDDYAIKEWGNLVDMSANWKDRTVMQNAVAGLNTITGLSTRYGFNDYLGGDKVVGGINDTLAMYTFGNSVYNLAKYWDNMSVGQQVGATLSTINSGVQAYSGLKSMYGMYSKMVNPESVSALPPSASATPTAPTSPASPASPTAPTSPTAPKSPTTGGVEQSTDWMGTAQRGLGAAAAGYTSYNYGRTMGMSEAESGIGGATTAIGAYYGDPYSMSAVFAYQSIRGFCENGRSTAKDRRHGAVAGAQSGAAIGAQVAGPVGAAIGACIGAQIGILSQSGKYGLSREEYKRRMYKDALVQSGILEKFNEGFEHKGEVTYQLADGKYYSVSNDGNGSRALDINGNKKTFYNKSMIAEGDKIRDNGEMNPYDIDYTCNMDYTGSLLLAPLNALGLGGSNTRDAGEYNQTLGYLTNAVTSNTGRDFTKENYDKMIANIKAGYERVGITNKDEAMSAIGLSYMMGNLTDDDYSSYKLAMDILYSNNGYNRAQTLMDQLGRGEQAKTAPIEVSSVSEPTSAPETVTEDVSVTQEMTPPQETDVSEVQTAVDTTERWNETEGKPIPETATEDVEQTQITEDMNSEDGSNLGVQA